mgnify:CR=1 FL=1
MAALAAVVDVPRDVPGWYPAVVLEVGEQDARIGIEGVENDGDGHWIPAEDVETFNDAIVGAIEVISEHRVGTGGSGAREP